MHVLHCGHICCSVGTYAALWAHMLQAIQDTPVQLCWQCHAHPHNQCHVHTFASGAMIAQAAPTSHAQNHKTLKNRILMTHSTTQL